MDKDHKRPVLHTPDREGLFQTFAQQGWMKEFVKQYPYPPDPPGPFNIQHDWSPEQWKVATFEAAMWSWCNSRFYREVKAYGCLANEKVSAVPRIYDHDRLVSGAPMVPEGLAKGDKGYFEVYGILMQRINGDNFESLVAKETRNPLVLQTFLQDVVNYIHDLNPKGFVHKAVRTKNVLAVRRGDGSISPILVGLAHCTLKWDYFVGGKKDWEEEYANYRRVTRNPRILAAEMYR